MKSTSATKKLILIVLDGVGIGELPDASEYGDEGSNTLVNTANVVGGLHLPNLQTLGLGNIAPIPGLNVVTSPPASYGKMKEVSKGKDSTTGHWELAGVILDGEFPTFPDGFPESLLQRFLETTGCAGYLGNTTASGTVIIQELGAEHVRTGFPIVYTSADSVFQIAAHEEVIPVSKLYEICQRTRDEVCVDEFAVGRVIARPFVGMNGSYTRTTNRRDFSLEPVEKTVLDLLCESGIETMSIGKVDDLFAGRGIRTKLHTRSNDEGIELVVRESRQMKKGFIFVNLVDFDTLYGHRNDPKGFAAALEVFDRRLPEIIETLGRDDLLIITADHGNDPVTPSTDHSREFVPLLCYAESKKEGSNLGVRNTFADVGKTVAHYFGVNNALKGESFLHSVIS
ncbi:MAG: phosphopentomutase [Ignavibacteriae bacterium]|nr:phosphopentomutase [Ignavibacteriota bacterium]